jgi:hypothetical protein
MTTVSLGFMIASIRIELLTCVLGSGSACTEAGAIPGLLEALANFGVPFADLFPEAHVHDIRAHVCLQFQRVVCLFVLL